jgi:hypothetical protein
VNSDAVGRLLQYDVVLRKRTADGPPDEYGNPTYTELEQPTVAELQQVGAREELGGAVQVSTWRVFLPADAPARGWDSLEVTAGPLVGWRFELNGDAAYVSSPITGLAHVEAYLEAVA